MKKEEKRNKKGIKKELNRKNKAMYEVQGSYLQCGGYIADGYANAEGGNVCQAPVAYREVSLSRYV